MYIVFPIRLEIDDYSSAVGSGSGERFSAKSQTTSKVAGLQFLSILRTFEYMKVDQIVVVTRADLIEDVKRIIDNKYLK